MSLELSGTTGVKGVAGSVSAPSIVGDDTNTGISFPSADTIKFSTGGVERFAISNSGLSGDGSGLTGIGGGITELDSWYLSASSSGTVNPISSNLARCGFSGDAFDKLGTGMSESSGVWTFPSTGHWLVQVQIFTELSYGRASRYNELGIFATENNSSYVEVARAGHYYDDYGTNRVGDANASAIIDCTNTSNVKVKFAFQCDDQQTVLVGSGSIYKTRFNFFRFADT